MAKANEQQSLSGDPVAAGAAAFAAGRVEVAVREALSTFAQAVGGQPGDPSGVIAALAAETEAVYSSKSWRPLDQGGRLRNEGGEPIELPQDT